MAIFVRVRRGSYREMQGFIISDHRGASIFCLTESGAERIALALIQGESKVIDAILTGERDPLFCVERVREKLQLYKQLGWRVRLPARAA